MEIKKGKMVECFAVTPNINISWIKFTGTNIYYIQFAWLFWYITFATKWGKDDNLLVKDIIAWLEKQDSQILANSAKTCKDEQKTAWSERDEYRYNACLQYFEEIKPDSVYYKDYLWLKSLKERINV